MLLAHQFISKFIKKFKSSLKNFLTLSGIQNKNI